MNIWQLSSNFRRDPSGQLTVWDEAKKPPKIFVTTKVYLTLRAEATFSSYRGNVASALRVSLPKISDQINSFKGSSKLINHSSQAWRKPFDSLLTHFETFGHMGAPVQIPMGKNIISQSPKIKTYSMVLIPFSTVLKQTNSSSYACQVLFHD